MSHISLPFIPLQRERSLLCDLVKGTVTNVTVTPFPLHVSHYLWFGQITGTCVQWYFSSAVRHFLVSCARELLTETDACELLNKVAFKPSAKQK